MAELHITFSNPPTDGIIHTADRPIIVEASYAGGGTTPVLINLQPQLYDNASATWLNTGQPLVQARDKDLNGSGFEVFTFDVSGFCRSYCLKYFDQNASSDRKPVFKSDKYIVEFRFVATKWVSNDGVLEHHDPSGSSVTSLEYKVIDATIDDFITIDDNNENLSGDNVKFMVQSDTTGWSRPSNCPGNLERRFDQNQKVWTGILLGNHDPGSLSHRFSIPYTAGVGSLSVVEAISSVAVNSFYATSLSKDAINEGSILSGSALFGNSIPDDLAFTTSFNISPELIGDQRWRMLKGMRHRTTTPIYWINDYNFIDFYNFEGFRFEEENSEKNHFFRKKTNFTNSMESNFGTAKGTTVVGGTVGSKGVSKEGAEWLSEIGRSTEVYIYDLETFNYIPILIDELNVVTLNDSGLLSVEVSYIKSTKSRVG
tara:strand:+ start:13739 stop:15022 length:1284 start_codon:yes stop_codon:yes gene_type:complete